MGLFLQVQSDRVTYLLKKLFILVSFQVTREENLSRSCHDKKSTYF